MKKLPPPTRWEYRKRGCLIFCADNRGDESLHALCDNTLAAETLCKLLNTTRKKEQRL